MPGKNRLWLWAACAAGAWYAAFASRRYVGFYYDDAAYVLLAKSLLAGKYANPALPGQMGMPLFPPGFPIFLAPFVCLLEPHWPALQALSCVLSVANLALAWQLYRGWLAPGPRVWALLLFALNPIVAVNAGAVISEPLYLTVSLAAFLALRRALSGKLPGAGWLLGALVGYAALVRLAGLTLVASVAAGCGARGAAGGRPGPAGRGGGAGVLSRLQPPGFRPVHGIFLALGLGLDAGYPAPAPY